MRMSASIALVLLAAAQASAADSQCHGSVANGRIDFPALAEHLYQLHRAARASGAGLALVIVDPRYLPMLHATPRGAYLRQHMPYMKGKPWVRHDEHYHIDFAIACKPLR